MDSQYSTPYPLLRRLRQPKIARHDVEELIHEFAKLEELYRNLPYALVGIRQDNIRLTHENQFMLRLIDKHSIAQE